MKKKTYLFIMSCVVITTLAITSSVSMANQHYFSEMIKKVMVDYVQQDIKLKGGSFLIISSPGKQPLQLTFEKLHNKVLYIKEEAAYYACADFRSKDKRNLYDIDFWVRKDNKGNLYVDRIILHKINGKSLFSYKNYTLLPLDAPPAMASEMPSF